MISNLPFCDIWSSFST